MKLAYLSICAIFKDEAPYLPEWIEFHRLVGFDGPPAHITLSRRLCVSEREWLPEEQFERAIAVTNLCQALPRPNSRSASQR